DSLEKRRQKLVLDRVRVSDLREFLQAMRDQLAEGSTFSGRHRILPVADIAGHNMRPQNCLDKINAKVWPARFHRGAPTLFGILNEFFEPDALEFMKSLCPSTYWLVELALVACPYDVRGGYSPNAGRTMSAKITLEKVHQAALSMRFAGIVQELAS